MAVMYIAVKDEVIQADGVTQTLKAGVTLVSEDSEAYRLHPDLFERADTQRGVEQATAAPGELREVSVGNADTGTEET